MDEQNAQLETEQVAAPTTEETQQPAEQAAQVETVEQTPAEEPQANELETLRKRLADTQAWGHQQAQRAAELQRAQEARRLQELESGLAPEVLDTVRNANEAVQLRQRQEQSKAEEALKAAVEEAVPEAMALVDNPKFAQFVAQEAQKAQQAGKNTASPLTAVAVMSRALREFNQSTAREAAEQAEKARKAKQMQSQSMPGAGAAVSAAKPPSDWTMDASAVKNMSPAEFEKLRRKGLGY